MNETVYIGGIDPGLATGGFVVLQMSKPALTKPPTVVWASSFVEKASVRKELQASLPAYYQQRPGDKNYALADLRAEAWCAKLDVALSEYHDQFPLPAAIAVESFIDQGSRSSGVWIKERWKTPHLIGRLVTILEKWGYTVSNGGLLFQDAGVALKQLQGELARMAAGEVFIPGGELLTNDHLRKSWAHAYTLALRWPTTTT